MTPLAVNKEHLPGPAYARLGALYRRQKAGLMQVLMGTSDRNTP